MAASTLDTIEGVANDVVHFHYDVSRDVLYLRLVSTIGSDSYSEETDDGFILVRDMTTDKPIGMTIISYWQRFGDRRALGDVSLHELDAVVAKSAKRAAEILVAA